MAEYVCGKFLTIPVSDGSVSTVSFAQGHKVDIMNNSDGTVMISEMNSFPASGTRNYLTLESGAGYNGLVLKRDKLYVKSGGAGTVSMVQR